jgi:hypothetical protein
MKLKCYLIFVFYAIVIFFTNSADASFTESEYRSVAKNFLTYINCSKTIKSVTYVNANQKIIGRIFHLDAGGYLIIPETTILPPIKGYSLKNDYHSLPQAYKDFIMHEMEVYQSSQSARSSSINSKRWDFLLKNTSVSDSKKSYTPDTFLLQTTWDQNYPYNKMLPKIGGQNVLAGCTQTALAQILKYHQHPERGKGIASHIWNNQTLETILFRAYHWDNMPDNLDNSTLEYFQDEVALLYKDLAIVNEADFGTDSTGSYVHVDSLYEYFGYATEIKEMTNENESEFFSVIQNEIDNLRPVLLSLPNHSTVADGYSSDRTGKKIHINMGWSGHADDYYYLNQTIYTEYYTFPVTSLRIKYNIKPCHPEANNCYENLTALETNDIKNGFQISGKFDSEIDIDTYREYLKGPSTITGDRGYDNQAFYIMVYNSKKELLISSRDPIEQDVPVDVYTIQISLNGYPFDDKDTYEVNITTQSVSDAEMDMIQNQDTPPMFNTEFQDQILSTGSQFHIRVDAVDEDGDIVLLKAISSTDIVNTTIEDDVLTLSSSGDVGHARIFVIASANGKLTQEFFDVLVCNDALGWGRDFEIHGIFENQDDYNTHLLLLEGQCQISGDNGYTSQGFYTSVLDHHQNTIIEMNTQTINQPFNKSMYWIGTSLKQNVNGSGNYIAYDPAHRDYVLSVNCPDASWTFQDVADTMGIDLTDTNIITLRISILYLQILAGNSVPNIADIMYIQDISRIEMDDVLYHLQYISEN